MPLKDFTDLIVWQRSLDLVVQVYKLTDAFPISERFVLTSQIRRSAISIPSNIAEGFRRQSTAAYLNFWSIALGSEGELYTQLELSRRLGFVADARLTNCVDELAQIGRMLRGLMNSLERRRSFRP